MLKVWTLLIITYLALIKVATPIKKGQHVGGFEIRNKKVSIFGHERYPYMVLIRVTVIKYGEPDTNECGGVIIGPNAVVTAGHCLYRKLNPTGTVHAGIVHRVQEINGGQKLQIKDYRIHELYQRECQVGKRCCYDVNDIAIVWTLEKFKFGPNVKIATLARVQGKPINKEGWIVGWGLDSNNEKPAILQMAEVKIVSNHECLKFDPKTYITQNLICLKGVNKGTSSALGDSGDPFVIDDVVYGICSMTVFSPKCTELDVYTFVPSYVKWIDRILLEGPPRQQANKFKPKHTW